MNTEIGVDNGDSRNDTKITNSVDSNTTSRTGMISIVSDNYMDIFQQAEDMRNANQVVEALELYKKVLELVSIYIISVRLLTLYRLMSIYFHSMFFLLSDQQHAQ